MTAAPLPTPGTVVMNFGGSFVEGPERIREVAQLLVAAREEGRRVVGTVSATGSTTDSLVGLARRMSPSPDPRELDMLLSTSERIACALVAIAVHELGHEAISLTGSQAGILTDAVYTRARIREIAPVRVLQALDEGKIVLVAGFQGFSRETMDVTTLGRGGSAATAVALAAALHASCEIYSDVPGVFTADPRIVPEARRLDRVSYEEMLEMSASGARMLMLRAVELARAHDVPILARSSLSKEPCTWVHHVEEMEQPIVSAVTHSDDIVVFSLSGLPDRPGTAAAVFESLAAENANVDSVVQNGRHDVAELSVAAAPEDVPAARLAFERVRAALGPLALEELPDPATVSLVGAGMRAHAGVAAKMFRTLADQGVDIRRVSTSPIRITVTVARSEVERAVRSLHAAFGLGEDAAAAAAN
jgi:aspartate kinase